MQDGYTQVGAGASDNRIAGEDLQHNRQKRTADENPTGQQRVVRSSMQSGGPMKEAIDAEFARHQESRAMRLQHLQDHYKR